MNEKRGACFVCAKFSGARTFFSFLKLLVSLVHSLLTHLFSEEVLALYLRQIFPSDHCIVFIPSFQPSVPLLSSSPSLILFCSGTSPLTTSLPLSFFLFLFPETRKEGEEREGKKEVRKEGEKQVRSRREETGAKGPQKSKTILRRIFEDKFCESPSCFVLLVIKFFSSLPISFSFLLSLFTSLIFHPSSALISAQFSLLLSFPSDGTLRTLCSLVCSISLSLT